MLQMANDIANYHHERWDGTGYPEQLAGEKIPEAARIVALADVFDAISHDRSYRKASPDNEVTKIMKEGRGTQFDPQLCDLFIELIPELKSIAQKNP